jgi:hypothetical protein
MRKPLRQFRFNCVKDHTIVVVPGGPAHIVGLDPGEKFINVERVRDVLDSLYGFNPDADHMAYQKLWEELKKELGLE